MIKKELKGTLNLQFEKILNNFFLFSKKHYIGWLHEKSFEKKKLKYSGIVLVRRDNPEIVKKIFKNIFRFVENNDFKEDFEMNLVNYFIDTINDVKDGKFDKKLFVNSKTLARDYANPE
jgi:DNA polymerase elongation subunit (family B)